MTPDENAQRTETREPELLEHLQSGNFGISLRKAKPHRSGLIHKIIPAHTWAQLRFELQAAKVRLEARRVRRRFEGADDLLVNLGAGPHGKPGWVNVDMFDAPGVNCQYDCRKSLPFPDRSVRGIFTEHFFEHIDYTEEVPFFLSECYRVLKDGGVIRIIVPDVGRYLQAYAEDGWEALAEMRELDANHHDKYGVNTFKTKMELINQLFRQGGEHKYAYDYETVAFVLDKYGFSNIKEQECGVSMMDELAIDRVWREAESLYVEAVKESSSKAEF